MLSEFEFLIEASHQLVEEWFVVVSKDISRHIVLVDDVYPNEVNNVLFLDFF